MASYTLSPVGGAGAQFFDNNGTPLSGGKLYTYAAGTTTPQQTWTTPAGITLNTNPIILNSGGRPPQEIWLSVAYSYKFVLTTSTDVLIATYDNVPGLPQPAIVNDASSISYEQGNIVNAGSFVVGNTYMINLVGSTNFIAIGAGANLAGAVFIATGVGSGSGNAYNTQTVQTKLQQTVSVKDFGAVGNGIADDLIAFNAAAATGTTVYVPEGDYLISAATSSGFWYLQDGAYISGLPDINAINDVSRLTGRIFYLENTGNGVGIRIGSSGNWVENVYSSTQSIGEVSILSTKGYNALVTGTRSSDDAVATNEGCVGITTNGINDWAGGRQPTWGFVSNTYRVANSGSILNEFSAETLDDPGGCDPYLTEDGLTAQLWLSTGHGNAASYGASCGIGFQPNPKGWERGIVMKDGSLDATQNPLGITEAMSLPKNAEITWYKAAATIYARTGPKWTQQSSLVTGEYPYYISYIERTGGAESQSGDKMYGAIYNFNTNAVGIIGATVDVFQSTSKVGGAARCSYQITSMNSGGGYAGVALNYDGNSRFTPMTDNTVDLGGASYRWAVVYAGTGAINTSDENEKTEIRSLSDKEKTIALNLKTKIKAFKFKDAVEIKGNNARIHFGIIAQDVKEAFEAENLNAENYGIFCSDTLKDGTIRLGVRYDELFAFIIGSI
jgi:hypothetical protein